MKKKIFVTVVSFVAVIIAVLGIITLKGSIESKKYGKEYFSEGAKLIAYNIGIFEETEDIELFRIAGVDIGELNDAPESRSVLDTEDKVNTFSALADAFRYNITSLIPHAKRLRSAFELLGENAADETAFKQIRTVLNSLE